MPVPEIEIKKSIFGRLRKSLFANPLLSGGALLAAAGLIGIVAWASGSLVANDKNVPTIEEALELLADQKFPEAREAAIKVLSGGELSDDQKGLPAYIIGTALVRTDCERERRQERKQGLYLIASRYFDEAELQGVPEDLRPDLEYAWGRSLYMAGSLSNAREPLVRAIKTTKENKHEILGWLGQVYLQDPQLSKAEGIQYVDQLLADPMLDSSQRIDALSLKARMLLKDKKIPLAMDIFNLLPEDSPERGRVNTAFGEAYLQEAVEKEEQCRPELELTELYQKAIDVLQQDMEDSDDLERARKRFLLGMACMGAGDLETAVESFTYVRRQFFDRPIGIAAGFWEAQCLLEMERFAEAFSLFTSILREAVRPNNQGETEWLNKESISKRIEHAVLQYVKLDDCASAVKLADHFRTASMLREPPIPLGDSAEYKSIALKRWIELLEEQSARVKFSEKEEVRSRIIEKYTDYGHALYSLAVNRYASADYSNYLFQAGEAYFNAEDYYRAKLAFQQYLDTNDDQRGSLARLRIGQSLLAQRKFAGAIEALTSCWTLFPNDPVVYQARYQAAECYLELSNPEQAQLMLRANLDNDALTPSSQEWINSLFFLGDLLFNEGMKREALSNAAAGNLTADGEEDPIKLLQQSYDFYQQAIGRLNEAVQREGRLPAAKVGRYYLADAYRRSNRWHEIQLSQTTINAKQVQLTDLIRRTDEKAIVYLDQLEEHLIEIREQRPLDDVEDKLLRNSFFTRGTLYFRLNQFEQSISMYRSASNLVILEPEVLEAYVQIAACYRRMNRNEEAKKIIDQAKIFLRDRIPLTSDFEETTRFSRERWVALLDWLSTI